VGRQWFTDPTNVKDAPTLATYQSYRSNGYNTAIVSARYEIGPVRIGVEVNNLFDAKPVTNISTGKTAPFDQYFYQVGRSFTGDITLTF
jgi:iron complex outermembrane receptor protein